MSRTTNTTGRTLTAAQREHKQERDRARRAETRARLAGGSDQSNDPVSRLMLSVKKGPKTVADLYSELGSSVSVSEVIKRARDVGFRVQMDGDVVSIPPIRENLDLQPLRVQSAGDMRIFAAVGDIHFGNRHHMRAQFQDFCRIAYERGCRQFLQGGDVLDGVYKHSLYEQNARGYEEQVAIAVRELPQLPGATWHIIQGNHDETLGEANGMDVGAAIVRSFREAGRTDVTCHGARGAYLRLVGNGDRRGIFAELWHPRVPGSNSVYGPIYPTMRKLETYAAGKKPDMLFINHWHKMLHVQRRAVHAFGTGCWQGGQSSFGKSIGGSPDIGSWIIEYATTSDGAVRRVRPEWIGYSEVEHVRDVALG